MERNVLNALKAVFDGLSSEEKKGRLDLGYRTTAGKHIVIELKKANRVVSLGELITQISKYSEAMKKVLIGTGHESEPFEIICVLGRFVDNDEHQDHRKQVDESLKTWHARIVYYQELIENAYKAYNDYLNADHQSQKLVEMMKELEVDMGED